VRYQHEAPGDLLHIDIKTLGRIERPSHRVTGNRRDSVDGAGWECLFVAIDDHARIGFSDMYPDERRPNAIQFLRNAVAYYASLGIKVKRLLTDNGPAFRSRDFAHTCLELGVRHKFTRAYRPQTNGKAERFIQSALREWAYGFTYEQSAQRTQERGALEVAATANDAVKRSKPSSHQLDTVRDLDRVEQSTDFSPR